MPRPKRRGRKGLAKMVGRPAKASKFDQDLKMLRKANRLVESMSPNARRWLKSQLG